MSDLISRKALLNHLSSWQMEQFAEVGHEKEYNLLDMIIRGVENEPSAQQWIPCSERLPEEDGEYLCQSNLAVMEVISFSNDLYRVDEYDFSHFKGKKKKGFYGFDSEMGYYETSRVIAWQPLPEAYKGE